MTATVDAGRCFKVRVFVDVRWPLTVPDPPVFRGGGVVWKDISLSFVPFPGLRLEFDSVVGLDPLDVEIADVIWEMDQRRFVVWCRDERRELQSARNLSD